jgi:hypothetical protein
VPVSGPGRLFGDRLSQVGGPGTPRVQEFSLAELAVAREQHVVGLRQVMADTLDLVHRLPRCWTQVQHLACEAWVARKVARLTHDLTVDQADLVDQAIAHLLGTQAPGRVLTVVEAKIIEADPDTHAARIEAEATRRCVHLSRSTDTGLRTLFARISAGDATWVDAMVDRVARILRDRGEPGTLDELRATAFGWLARPAELLTLLLDHEHPGHPADEPDQTSTTESGQPEDPAEPWRSRTTAFPADLLDTLRTLDPTKLRPDAVLHIHLHQAALEGRVDGVARGEDLGPFLPEQLHDLLGHTNLHIEPVIDLADQISTTSYEHPEQVKNRVFQIIGGDYFPHAPSQTRNLDYDHVIPYHPHSPHGQTAHTGQTGTHNSGPLTRTHHRIKTFAPGWAARQPGPGTYVWRTPHNLYRLVDHHGTHPLTEEDGERYFTDPAAPS